jgi:ubiquinone/menaquinone biosynthesis C-methylase UbiE
MSTNESYEVWTRIWSQAALGLLPQWDQQSELAYQVLRIFNRNFKGQLMLEEGSGTGRISLRLAKEGKAILLDISGDALKYSKKRARKTGGDAHFIRGSIFNLPLRESSLDLIWNSGVLEHYKFEKQQQAIHEALRTLRKRGLLVVIVPNKKAIFYNLSRVLDMKLGRWKFGYEEPLNSKELHAFSPEPDSLCSLGILYQFRFITVPILGFLLNRMLSSFIQFAPYLEKLDKKSAKSGYLLAGVWKKKE